MSRAGSLPSSRPFWKEPFKNGSDPLSLYKTLSQGLGQMPAWTFLTPEQRYDAIHYIRETFVKPHNSTAYFNVTEEYHDALPKRLRQYLNGRGIPDHIINSHILGWNGWRITIPIYNRKGEVVFFKLAKDPDDSRPAPKMLTSPGAGVELYGWDRVLQKPEQIIICEGEFDRLVLEAQGFFAVTSTGGAATFRPESHAPPTRTKTQ